ncbi:MAG: TIGR02266 family protein [Pseudomonadota bacterium]
MAKPHGASSDPKDRRRHRRVPLNLLVQHRFETLEAFMEEIATDLSAGGLFLRTDSPHAIGSTIYLRFALADGMPLIEGIGRVVWASAQASADQVPGMGIEFLSLDDESRQLIDTIVAARGED